MENKGQEPLLRLRSRLIQKLCFCTRPLARRNSFLVYNKDMNRENKLFLSIGLWILFLSIIAIPYNFKITLFILTGSILFVLSLRGGIGKKILHKMNEAGEMVFEENSPFSKKSENISLNINSEIKIENGENQKTS